MNRSLRRARLAFVSVVVAMLSLAVAVPAWSAAPSSGTKKEGPKQEKGKKEADAKKDVPAAKPAAAKVDKAAAAKKDEKPKADEKAKEEKKPEAKPCDDPKTATAADKKKTEKEGTAATAAAKPATCKVKKQRFKIDVSLDGLFEALKLSDVALRTKEWSDFEVLTAVEHGARVKQGEVLVTLETERIDRVIADLQRDQTLSRLAFQDAEHQLAALKTSAPLDLAGSERNKRYADEDLSYFLKVERPMSERIVNFNLKMAESSLAYAKEELRQLEKMYKADDLVEETEEIVLKRARDTVNRAQFMVDYQKVQGDNVMKMMLPRAEEMQKTATQRQANDLTKVKLAQPIAMQRLELTLEKMKIESTRSEERLKKLQADRSAMTVKSPVSGVVYYGRCVRGKWTGTDTVGEKLRRGGRLSGDDVFMTIVETRPMQVRTSVPEKQLQNMRVGLKAIVRPTGYPELRLPAIVQSVGSVPLSGKEFDTRLTVALDDSAAALVPGMTCDVKVAAYQKADAVVVAAGAVYTDDETQKQYVAVPGKDGKPQKRAVTTGKRTDKQVEILKGLADGDEIFQEYPKDLE